MTKQKKKLTGFVLAAFLIPMLACNIPEELLTPMLSF